jgi:hypothetical protein
MVEKSGYPAVKIEKTIFMKRQGDDFIIHGLFVDDVMQVPTCDSLKHWQEFIDKYTKDFDIIGGCLMVILPSYQVESRRPLRGVCGPGRPRPG